MWPKSFMKAVVIMGVSGSGKSTIGKILAKRNDFTFHDADDLHSIQNKEKMGLGIPLTDADRIPWLQTIGDILTEAESSGYTTIIACSALKRSYRDLLRTFQPNVFFVHLNGTREAIEMRLLARKHEFMPASLLDSQFSTLEPLGSDELGVVEDISQSPIKIVAEVEKLIVISSH